MDFVVEMFSFTAERATQVQFVRQAFKEPRAWAAAVVFVSGRGWCAATSHPWHCSPAGPTTIAAAWGCLHLMQTTRC